MELRLIHAVEHRKSWFAKWEYELSGVHNGIDSEEYEEVVDKLSSTPVMDIIHDFERAGKDERLRGIVNHYHISDLDILQQLLIRMKELKEQCLKPYPKGGLISDAIPERGIISEIISNSNLGWQEIIEKINGDLDYIYEDILLGYDKMKNSTAAILKARHFKKSFPLATRHQDKREDAQGQEEAGYAGTSVGAGSTHCYRKRTEGSRPKGFKGNIYFLGKLK